MVRRLAAEGGAGNSPPATGCDPGAEIDVKIV